MQGQAGFATNGSDSCLNSPKHFVSQRNCATAAVPLPKQPTRQAPQQLAALGVEHIKRAPHAGPAQPAQQQMERIIAYHTIGRANVHAH